MVQTLFPINTVPLQDQEMLVRVVDSDKQACNSVAAWLSSAGYSSAVFDSAEQFLSEGHDDTRRGCLLLDYCLPGKTGLDAYSRVMASAPMATVLMSREASISDVSNAMRMGAIRFLEKPFSGATLLSVVKEAIGVDIRVNLMSERVLVVGTRIGSLTPREQEVLRLVIDGVPTKSIARKLEVSIKTIEVHRSNIKKRLKVGSLPELVSLVTEYRVVTQEFGPNERIG